MGKNQSNERYGKEARHIRLPRFVQKSVSYEKLNSQAIELLNEVLYNTTSFNNGNLLITWPDYAPLLSFTSVNTFRKALKELTDNDILRIVGTGSTSRTRGKPPYLYALTWLNINVVHLGDGSKSNGHERAPLRSQWEESEKRRNYKPP